MTLRNARRRLHRSPASFRRCTASPPQPAAGIMCMRRQCRAAAAAHRTWGRYRLNVPLPGCVSSLPHARLTPLCPCVPPNRRGAPTCVAHAASRSLHEGVQGVRWICTSRAACPCAALTPCVFHCRYSDKYPFRMRSETPEIAIELSLQACRRIQSKLSKAQPTDPPRTGSTTSSRGVPSNLTASSCSPTSSRRCLHSGAPCSRTTRYRPRHKQPERARVATRTTGLSSTSSKARGLSFRKQCGRGSKSRRCAPWR